MTYNVTAEQVAAMVPGLFQAGFTQATKPTLATVQQWIADADGMVTLHVLDTTGTTPLSTDAAAVYARRYIIDDVLILIYRAVYAGKASPADLAPLLTGFDPNSWWLKITELGEQAAGAGAASSTVGVPYTTPPRALEVDDTDLDRDSGYRSRC